jgi:hypothetical protein
VRQAIIDIISEYSRGDLAAAAARDAIDSLLNDEFVAERADATRDFVPE